ncbi:oligosaccharide flippase family protein [Prescottella equi]|uniref:oligosaccharide flippase family protein n=1 Tax=Rhodococcus hoagii TaxID=43767 RepID=UPI0009BF01EF|nr:hypothetical protein A6409_07430 [Prescottella equi]
MKSLVWAFLERVLPRAASAVIMLGLAAFLTPEVVGLYALGILAMTLYQAASDTAIRQIAVSAVVTKHGRHFLRRYAWISTVAGMIFISGSLTAIFILTPSAVNSQAVLLTPLIAVPGLMAARVGAIARIQLASRWRALATFQLIGTAASFVVSVPILLLTRSLLASSLQIVITELAFTLLALTAARGIPVGKESPRDEYYPHLGREFWHLSTYSVLAWFQSQTDRLLMGPVAGSTALGLFSVANSVARSGGDAVSTSTANVLRPELLTNRQPEPREIGERADGVLTKAVLISAGATVATLLGIDLVLRPILSSQWDYALSTARIISLTIIPTLFSWSMTVVLVAADRTRWAAPIKFLGIPMAVPIALVAAHSLLWAGTFVVVREVVLLVLLVASSGGAYPRRSLWMGAALWLVMCLAVGASLWILG